MDRKQQAAGLVLAVYVLFAAASGCGKEDRHVTAHSHSFSDIAHYAERMDSTRRDKWQKPDKVIATMRLKKGDHVADVGAGTGYFARRIALAVAPGGSVTGYDTEKNMVAYMRDDARKRGIDNYRAELVTATDQVYPAGRFDVIFMCNVYHHVDEGLPFLQGLGKALKKSGRIIMVDHKMDAPYGPPKKLRIAKRQAIADFNSAGFVLVKDEDILPEQYYLEFRAK